VKRRQKLRSKKEECPHQKSKKAPQGWPPFPSQDGPQIILTNFSDYFIFKWHTDGFIIASAGSKKAPQYDTLGLFFF
jgi:hypothetical protein